MGEKTFGSFVRARRKGRLTQQQLGDAVGTDRTYIVKIENGTIGLPQRELREAIGAVLGFTEYDLRALGIVGGDSAHIRSIESATVHTEPDEMLVRTDNHEAEIVGILRDLPSDYARMVYEVADALYKKAINEEGEAYQTSRLPRKHRPS